MNKPRVYLCEQQDILGVIVRELAYMDFYHCVKQLGR